MAPKSPKTRMLRLRVNEMAVHPTAQRELILSHVKYLNEKIDLDSIGVLHVVKYKIRNAEKYWIVDGQHRWKALIEGGCGDLVVDVQHHLDIVDDIGANKLFLQLNETRKPTAFQRFSASLRAAMPRQVGVARICHERGLKIKPATANSCVCCVQAMLKIFDHDDGATLSITLDVIRDAWGNVSASMEGMIVEGLGRVIMQHRAKLDIASLVQKLAKYRGGPAALHGDAKGLLSHRRNSVSRSVTEIILDVYNTGRRSGKL